jgi:ferredoxin-nitrate reductase
MDHHADGFLAFREQVMQRTIDEAAELCGIDSCSHSAGG